MFALAAIRFCSACRMSGRRSSSADGRSPGMPGAASWSMRLAARNRIGIASLQDRDQVLLRRDRAARARVSRPAPAGTATGPAASSSFDTTPPLCRRSKMRERVRVVLRRVAARSRAGGRARASRCSWSRRSSPPTARRRAGPARSRRPRLRGSRSAGARDRRGRSATMRPARPGRASSTGSAPGGSGDAPTRGAAIAARVERCSWPAG